MFPRVLIAGTRGGAGKTTVTLSIIYALKKKGLKVITFKKGPDYIDSGWLSLFSESPCYNLDTFMIPKERVIQSFIERSTGDISIIEGNRALYDGLDSEGTVSSAELAKLLKCPVILVIDCTKITRSVAALINGFVNFDREVNIKGVILNQIANSRHERIVKESIKKYSPLEILGVIPRFKDATMPERHMGLLPYQEHEMKGDVEQFIGKVSENLDIERTIEIAKEASLLDLPSEMPEVSSTGLGLRIGVIRDRVFQFYYEENLEELKRRGAKLTIIDSLTDKALPEIDALYIGGGFPETNVNYLCENAELMRHIREEAERGLPIYAECGGLMYLCRGLHTEGRFYPMIGVFPFILKMFKKPQAHGYVVAKVEEPNPFYQIGTEIRGHEFHYSRVVEHDEKPRMCFTLLRGEGIIDSRDGACYRNVLGTYIHIHALGTQSWVEGILKRAKIYKESKDA